MTPARYSYQTGRDSIYISGPGVPSGETVVRRDTPSDFVWLLERAYSAGLQAGREEAQASLKRTHDTLAHELRELARR